MKSSLGGRGNRKMYNCGWRWWVRIFNLVLFLCFFFVWKKLFRKKHCSMASRGEAGHSFSNSSIGYFAPISHTTPPHLNTISQMKSNCSTRSGRGWSKKTTSKSEADSIEVFYRICTEVFFIDSRLETVRCSTCWSNVPQSTRDSSVDLLRSPIEVEMMQ